MFPLLFNLGPIPIHTYGVMIAIGFLLGLQAIRYLAERDDLDVERVLDVSVWALIVGLIGSRTLFVITQYEYFLENPLAIIRFWEGGMVFLGGPLAALPFGIWYFRRYKLPFWRTMDATMPGLALGHGFGRIGCLASGCCYGRPTGGDWGIVLNSPLVDPTLRGILLHPTQLYESVSLFALFGGLVWTHRHRIFPGQVMLTYYMSYSVIRSVIEEFRGDKIRGFVFDGWLSTSQFISGLIFIACLVALIYQVRKTEGKVAS
jgi:phosphatidylglycerol:prolipoprotein diacylglycerol transferase